MKEWFKKIKGVNVLFLMKTGIGSALAIILAESLGLAYSPSAGIITLLTIQNTKKETISIALKRFVAFMMAVVITYIMFTSFGYTPMAFGGFVFLFVALCILLGLKDGISMNAVLMTHFLIEKRMDLPLVLNEIALLLIGMIIGIVLNLIMPRYRERIRREQQNLEEEMKKTLHGLADLLKDKSACLIQEKTQGQEEHLETKAEKQAEMEAKTEVETEAETKAEKEAETGRDIEVDFSKLDSLLDGTLRQAYEDAGNTLLSNTKYLVSYLEMRKLQIGVLKGIKENIEHIPVLLRQSFPLADYMDHIADSFHELNNVKGLLEGLEELYDYYRREKLPQTREEFEYRAVLFQILKELEYFLLLKRNFVLELERKDMKTYWS